MPVKKLKNGKWRADVQDARRGLARHRRIFDTKAEALEWSAASRSEAHDILMGRRPKRTFGEALARYLAEVAPNKKSFMGGESAHVQTLRWPFLADGQWRWLEQLPLEAPAGQLNIISGMAAWLADMRAVVKRSRLGGEVYQLRRTGNGLKWYWQPAQAGNPSEPPPPRQEITWPKLLEELRSIEGRGPYSNDTLRIRQCIVKTILKRAWRAWDWTDSDLSARITPESGGGHRRLYLTQAQAEALMTAARATEYGPHLADVILGAILIGWRRANVMDMTWANVHWPILDDAGHEIQMGYIAMPGDKTKTGADLAQPISRALLDLLRNRQAVALGDRVFHRGDGQPFGDFRRTWARIKAEAGIDPGLRWHDLRHTWASWLIQSGASERHLMELGGWTSPTMPKTYAHLKLEHLREVVELPHKTRNPDTHGDKK